MISKKSILLFVLSLLFLHVYSQTICSRNCKTCTSSDICTQCQLNYFLDSTQTCKPCNNGCKNCTAPPTGSTLGPVCIQCLPDFNLNTTRNQCFNCDLNCLRCVGTPTNCTLCSQGLNLTISSGLGSCQRDRNCTNDLCKNCRPGSNNLCQSCRSGYYLKSDGSCNKCQYPCLNCQFDINATEVIQNFKAGITEVQRFVNTYNLYLSQLQDFLTKYMNWYITKMFDPSVTFSSFIPSDANYSLLGPSSNYQSLNLSSPNWTLMMHNIKQYFKVFVDQSFFISLSRKIEGNAIQFQKAFNFGNSSQFSGPNFPGYSNFSSYSRNYSDFFANYSGFFGNYSSFFGNYSNIYGNGSSNNGSRLLQAAQNSGNNTFGNYSDLFGNYSDFFRNYNDYFGNYSNFYGNQTDFFNNYQDFFSNYSSFFGNYSNLFGNNSNFFGNRSGNNTNFNNYSGFFSNYSSLFGNYSHFFGNMSNNTNNSNNLWGNFSFSFNNSMSTNRITVQYFLRFLYNQTGFRRYFKGTFEQLMGTQSLLYFNFDSAPASCRGCMSGFFFNATTNSCLLCQPNCLNCNSTLACTECVLGFVNSGTGDKICLKCEPPCLTCNGSISTCISCVAPFKLTSSNTCILCSSPCATCSPTNSTRCVDCMAPYSRSADSGGVCFRCKQDICKNCLSTNTSICVQCSNGTSLIDGQCQLCPKKCLQCSVSTNTSVPSQCYKCQQRFVLNTTTKSCVPCLQGCLVCKQQNPSVCVTCQSGTYKNDLGACKLCGQACLQCTDNVSCTTYKGGRTMVGNQIVQCRKGCKKCSTQNLQTCLQCEDKFVLNSTVCLKCKEGCLSCSLSDRQTCILCPPDRIISSGSCVSCPQNCTTCSSPSVCTACRMGYILNSTTCVDAKNLCPTGCLSCNSTNCSQCSFGFVLSSNGKCVQCVANCGGSCDASNPLVCTGCTNGFQSIEGKCVRCPLNCRKCSDSVCSQCKEGYKLAQNTSGTFCQRECIYPCKTCTDTACLQCSTNFTMSASGKCEPDLTCGGVGCLFCMSGSYKDTDGACQKCQTNCISCTSSTFCLGCGEGYYATSAGQCTSCPEGTAVCLDSTSSVSCRPGYIKEAVSLGSTDSTDLTSATFDQTCKPCKSPCKQCMVLRNLCVSCINDDYRLNGTSCIKKLVVGIQIKFDYNFATFLSEGALQTILNTLITKVNATIIVTNLRNGSTVVGIAASPDSTSSAADVASGVTTSINNGDLALPIVGSSVGLFFQDSPFSSNSNQASKAGMIAGIVVGTVVFIAVLAVIIYKVRTSKQLFELGPDSHGQIINVQGNKQVVQEGENKNLNPFGYPNNSAEGASQFAFNNDKILFA